MKRFFVSILIAIGLITGTAIIPRAEVRAVFAIQPGKISINNMYPGGVADFFITVYNDANHQSTYTIKVRVPDYTEAGYEPLPYLEWVKVGPGDLTVAAGEQSDVEVTISVPQDADYSSKKGEVWVSFIEQAPATQSGAFPIEVVARLLINMLDAAPGSAQPYSTETPEIVAGNGSNNTGAGKNVTLSKSSFSPWVIAGAVIGVITVAVLVFYLTRKWQHR